MKTARVSASLALSLFSASMLVSCIYCDKNICILEGYRWCMHAAGAKGPATGKILDILHEDGTMVRGCACLTAAENALIDADGNGEVDDLPLDPNTEYYSVLDIIRTETRKRCIARAKELQIKPGESNCHAITEGFFLGKNDGEPSFAEVCYLDKYEAPCPDGDDATRTSSTKGDKPASGTGTGGAEPTQTTAEPEPTGGGPAAKPPADAATG